MSLPNAPINPSTSITIIVSAITLVGLAAAIALNYSPAPVHAAQCWLRPDSGGFPCYSNKHLCEQTLPPDAVVSCFKAKK